ncbi:hypothetical protein PsAD13_03205 [Pseudovibrio sp. Ad13]|uniref:hypothetical protein n=1 Tax=Pseudovibrio sp. Ad13 TaxID=989396 RepID=UPI0007AED739|nr:hypothetical protein [Pseudovibrio sp. Ad13]KZK83003.1 hypothetical protein PsAD13_03205 [Pseudovibrio sp. Ad13]
MDLWNSKSIEEKIEFMKEMKLQGASAGETAKVLGVGKSTLTSFLCRNFTSWSGLLQHGTHVPGDGGIDSDLDVAIVECHSHLEALYEHHPERAPKSDETKQLYNGSLPHRSSVVTYTYPAFAA